VCNGELESVTISDSAVLSVVSSCECTRCNKSSHSIQNPSYKSRMNPLQVTICMRNEVNKAIQSETLKCWYY
jgi:hypothetical protein